LGWWRCRHRFPPGRPDLLLLLLPLAPFLFGAAPFEKVVVLGFDGADAALVERYMAEGRLPNLSRLRAEGSYAQLRPTNPPQTPVSWASFTTGPVVKSARPALRKARAIVRAPWCHWSRPSE